MTKSSPDPISVFPSGDTQPTFLCLHDSDTLFVGYQNGCLSKIKLSIRRTSEQITSSTTENNAILSLFTCGDGIVQLNRATGLVLRKLSSLSNVVGTRCLENNVSFCGAAYSDDLSIIATPGIDFDIDLIPFDKLTDLSFNLSSLSAHEAKLGAVMCLKFIESPSGEQCFLLAGYEAGLILLWNLHQPHAPISQFCPFASHDDGVLPVTCLDFNSSLRIGVCGSPSNTVCFFRLNPDITLSSSINVELPSEGTNAIAIRPSDGRITAFALTCGRVRIYGTKTAKLLASLQYHKKSVRCVLFSQFDGLLYAAADDCLISVWDIYRSSSGDSQAVVGKARTKSNLVF